MSDNQNPSSSSGNIPSHVQIVVIGGGVIGCSIAYHLTNHEVAVEISTYTCELLKTLEAENGQITGFKMLDTYNWLVLSIGWRRGAAWLFPLEGRVSITMRFLHQKLMFRPLLSFHLLHDGLQYINHIIRQRIFLRLG